MRTIIGLVLLAAVVLALTGAFIWIILGRMAARHRLSGPVELLLDYLPDATSTTPRGLNRAIKALIRRAAIPAADGKRAMSLIVIRLRPEDLAVLKAAYGLQPYIAGLASYHRKVAARKQWELPRDLSTAEIRFVEDPDRKPMRPALDDASSVAVLPSKTKFFTSEDHSPATEDLNPTREDQGRRSNRIGHEKKPDQLGTEKGARLVGPGVDQVFFPSEAPITIGRSRENTVVIRGETVHRQHARLDYAGGSWMLLPVNLGNSTTVNGLRITEPARVSPPATLSFGDSEGFTFSTAP